MDASVKVSGTGGVELQDTRDIPQVIDTSGDTLCVGDGGDILTHQEKYGQVSPLGDPMNDGTEADTAGRWELVLPTSGSSNVRSGLGGGGDLRRSPPENIHIVHHKQTHCEYVSGSGAAHGSTGLPSVVGTGISGPGRDVGGIKGCRYGIEGGGGGGWRLS